MPVYPNAANLLIPRGTVGSPTAQPIIKPTIIILHTNGGNVTLAGAANLMANTTKGQEYHFQQESDTGRLGQYVDTRIRADNNYKANSFTSGGVLCGAESIETADHGTPYELSWSDLGQRRNLEDLVVWLCQTHDIPARRCPDPYSPGIGYHAMWGYNVASTTGEGTYGHYTAPDGRRALLNNPWTNALGKICPGPGKIREFNDLLAAVARRVEGGAEDMPLDATDIAKVGAEMVRVLRAPEFQVGFVDNIVATIQSELRTVAQDVDHLEVAMNDLIAKVDAISIGGVDVAAIAAAVATELSNRLTE